MKTIWADFNAVTDADELCLTTRGSEEAIRRSGLGPGDWSWFSDGEVFVGGQIRDDPYWGLIAVPDWETLVSLDTDEARDSPRVWKELRSLLDQQFRTHEEEVRVFELFNQLDRFAYSDMLINDEPGSFDYLLASCLNRMGKARIGDDRNPEGSGCHTRQAGVRQSFPRTSPSKLVGPCRDRS